MQPKVTLIIPTYNWPEALQLSLSSAISQSTLPDEIIIADDGSTDDTYQIVEKIRKLTEVPIIHIWQEDNGFRKTNICNKAIVQAKGDYIIQVDGDVILNKYFIQDHLELVEDNYFICGSRVRMDKKVSQVILNGEECGFSFFKQMSNSVFNGFRSRVLRKFLSKRYAKNNFNRLRGCNMSYWKKDAIKINGYNEDFTMWGYEDSEFAYRLHYSGVQKKFVKMGGVVFHIYHKELSKANIVFQNSLLENVIKNKVAWCENGINKYM